MTAKKPLTLNQKKLILGGVLVLGFLSWVAAINGNPWPTLGFFFSWIFLELRQRVWRKKGDSQ